LTCAVTPWHGCAEAERGVQLSEFASIKRVT
jgi:hypothetical protein